MPAHKKKSRDTWDGRGSAQGRPESPRIINLYTLAPIVLLALDVAPVIQPGA